MPFRYMAASMLGLGFGGLFSNVLKLIALLAYPSNDKASAFTFFPVGAFFILIIAFSYCLILQRNECFQFYLNQMSEVVEDDPELSVKDMS